MIRQRHDFLPLRFIRDFRPTEDDDQVWADAFEQGDDLRRLLHIPNIDAETDDAWLVRENGLHDLQRLLVDDELGYAGAILKLPQVRHEVAKAEGGVDVFGVERGEDDVRHGRAYSPNLRARLLLLPFAFLATALSSIAFHQIGQREVVPVEDHFFGEGGAEFAFSGGELGFATEVV